LVFPPFVYPGKRGMEYYNKTNIFLVKKKRELRKEEAKGRDGGLAGGHLWLKGRFYQQKAANYGC
jgi:hypothetical protein